MNLLPLKRTANHEQTPPLPFHPPELVLHAALQDKERNPSAHEPNKNAESISSAALATLEAEEPERESEPERPSDMLFEPTAHSMTTLSCILPRVFQKALVVLDEATSATRPTAFTSPAGRVVLRVSSHTVLISGLRRSIEESKLSVGDVEHADGACFWCGCRAFYFRTDGEVCKHIMAAALAHLNDAIPVQEISDQEIVGLLEDEVGR